MAKRKVAVLLFPYEGAAPITELWASAEVMNLLLGRERKPPVEKLLAQMRKKLKYYCESGFGLYLDNEYGPIKKEHEDAFGLRLGDHYRLAGFFEKGRSEFIAIEYADKKRQRNNSRLKAMYRRVNEVKRSGAWTKVK